MKNHTKVYMKAMGYTDTDFICCEVCNRPANSVHHIEARGMGGSKLLDTPENLMALCQECHHEADFGVELSKDFLKAIHLKNLYKFPEILSIQLPVIVEFKEFCKNFNFKYDKVCCTYKLSFCDGLFYIGMSGNLLGRIYNHCTYNDLNDGCKPTKKHERMLLAIKNNELISFEIISESKRERDIIKENIKNDLCLNMK